MSNQPFRVSGFGLIDRDHPIEFSFNGRNYIGFKGDTLASALLANGVRLFARSFKFHRPRGVFGSGFDEPNALVQVGIEGKSTPNERATILEIYQGMSASSVNVWPSVFFDLLSVNNIFSSLLPAGFYYKTFMWPASFWPIYEFFIRKSAGLGRVPIHKDPDRYDKKHMHCDVLIVGAGVSGLASALVCARSGARVIIVDQRSRLGGSRFSDFVSIDNKSIKSWVSDIETQLSLMKDCRVLKNTTAVIHSDHNYVVLSEKVAEDDIEKKNLFIPRERLWKVRAKKVIYATGALERPIVFQNNDLPGVMLVSAVSELINCYGVCPGKKVVLAGNNDSIYSLARDLQACGAKIVALFDARQNSDLKNKFLSDSTFPIFMGKAPLRAFGRRKISSVTYGSVNKDGIIMREVNSNKFNCDLLCISGGYDPNLNLFSQAGGNVSFNSKFNALRGTRPPKNISIIGAAAGELNLPDALSSAFMQGLKIVKSMGFNASSVNKVVTKGSYDLGDITPVWCVDNKNSRTKQFVDLHNDVTVSDIELAALEGYESIEHFKRYTTSGMGPDQGKTGNVNALALLAKILKVSPDLLGTTSFRPPYIPTTFGALAGRELGNLAEPIRITALHNWHQEAGAIFEDVGQWKRPWYYPKIDEKFHNSVNRECLSVRTSVGIFDASTLGKINIYGPDAGEFLNRIYVNRFDNLKIGSCRYGLICGEDGMIMDDGVTSRLGEKEWLMNTTTGNASKVFHWLDDWLQCEWPELKVFLTSVSSQWSTITVAGPNARKVISQIVKDIDLSNNAFPHLTFKNALILGINVRILRVSFTGELSYEINIPSRYALSLWENLMNIGKPYDITPFGTEALHTLRAEKGYIAIGHETDGSVSPEDIGFGWMMKNRNSFLGYRSLLLENIKRKNRKQLVGLMPETHIPEGSQVLSEHLSENNTNTNIGHVTSSYYSPSLKRPIALALISEGRSKVGTEVKVLGATNSKTINAQVVAPTFYDISGDRLNV